MKTDSNAVPVKVQLADVAERAGVAVSTVSHVLNSPQHPVSLRISEKTKGRVREAARELGYRPDLFAQFLRSGSRKFVMLSTAFLGNYSATIAAAFESAAARRGYRVLVSVGNPRDAVEGANAAEDMLGPHGIQSLATIGSSLAWREERLRALSAVGVNIVMVGHRSVGENILSVSADIRGGVAQAAAHLIDLGARSLWAYGGSRAPVFDQRIAGFRDAARGLGCKDVRIIVSSRKALCEDDFRRNAREDLGRALGESEAPDAIFAGNDISAMGALQALADRGLVPGRDVAVVGFDDTWLAAATTPPLTSVHVSIEDLGRIAADMLLDAAEGKPRQQNECILPTTLSSRESSAGWRREQP